MDWPTGPRSAFRLISETGGSDAQSGLATVGLPLDYSTHTPVNAPAGTITADDSVQTVSKVFSDSARAGADVVSAMLRALVRFGLRLNAANSAVSAAAAYQSEQQTGADTDTDAAGQSACAANQSKLDAGIERGLAEAAQGAAVTAKGGVEIVRAGAQTFSNAAARMSGDGMPPNPMFNLWSGANPAGVTVPTRSPPRIRWAWPMPASARA